MGATHFVASLTTTQASNFPKLVLFKEFNVTPNLTKTVSQFSTIRYIQQYPNNPVSCSREYHSPNPSHWNRHQTNHGSPHLPCHTPHSAHCLHLTQSLLRETKSYNPSPPPKQLQCSSTRTPPPNLVNKAPLLTQLEEAACTYVLHGPHDTSVVSILKEAETLRCHHLDPSSREYHLLIQAANWFMTKPMPSSSPDSLKRILAGQSDSIMTNSGPCPSKDHTSALSVKEVQSPHQPGTPPSNLSPNLAGLLPNTSFMSTTPRLAPCPSPKPNNCENSLSFLRERRISRQQRHNPRVGAAVAWLNRPAPNVVPNIFEKWTGDCKAAPAKAPAYTSRSATPIIPLANPSAPLCCSGRKDIFSTTMSALEHLRKGGDCRSSDKPRSTDIEHHQMMTTRQASRERVVQQNAEQALLQKMKDVVKQRQLAKKKQSDERKKEAELRKKEEDKRRRAMAAKEATVVSPSNPPQMKAEK